MSSSGSYSEKKTKFIAMQVWDTMHGHGPARSGQGSYGLQLLGFRVCCVLGMFGFLYVFDSWLCLG